MSRSTNISSIPDGVTLVIISDVKKTGKNVSLTLESNDSNTLTKEFDYKKSEFLKMCYSAGTISGDVIFDDELAIGKRMWIHIENGILIDTFPYQEGTDKPVEMYNWSEAVLVNPKANKKAVIEEARAMIAKVEAKDDFDLM